MTQEQKQNLEDVKAAEQVVVLVELTENQTAVLHELEIFEDRDNIATSAFASALRGKMQSAIDKAIKAKYEADSRGKKAVSAELETEIQRGIVLKRGL
jgi:hypothetical protein